MKRWIAVVVASMIACGNKADEGSKKAPAETSAPGSAAPPQAAPQDAQASPSPSPSAPASAGMTQRRPEWITTDKPNEGACTDRAGRLDCVGVSAFSADKEIAKQTAAAVALDTMARHVAREAAAQKAGRAWTPNDQSDVPPNALKAARKEIDTALGIQPSAPPTPDDHYWEEYAKQTGSGTETLAWVRLGLAADRRKTIAAKLASAK